MFVFRSELAVEAHPLSPVAGLGGQTRTAALWHALRRRATTTPGKLALVSMLVVAGALCFGLVATLASRTRSDAAQAARTQTEPLLVQGYDGMKQREATIPAAARVRLTEALERLVQLYDAWGQKDKADAWLKKLEEYTRKRAAYQDQQAAGLMTLDELAARLSELEDARLTTERDKARERLVKKFLESHGCR